MIRVLQYIGSLSQGGSQAMIMNLYRNINRDEIQFDFVIHDGKTTQLSEEAQKLGATIYCCPAYGLTTAKKYADWWKRFFREHPEYKVVHSHVRSTAAIVLGIAKKTGCKTIAHSHSTSSGSGIGAIVKNILQYRIRYVADYFMGCSQVAGEWLFGKKICTSDRYFNMKNAIATDRYTYSEKIANGVRAELGFQENDTVIGHVGRFTEAKNHEFLIKVFHEMHKKNDHAKLLLVGDGELRKNAEQLITTYNLNDSVLFAGIRQDVNRMLMAMDIFLFPSLWEGLPVSLIEAQATGLSCFASSSITGEACLTDLVTYLSLDLTPAEWADKLLSCKAGERSGYSEKIATAGYDIKASAVWLSNFYLSLISN